MQTLQADTFDVGELATIIDKKHIISKFYLKFYKNQDVFRYGTYSSHPGYEIILVSGTSVVQKDLEELTASKTCFLFNVKELGGKFTISKVYKYFFYVEDIKQGIQEQTVDYFMGVSEYWNRATEITVQARIIPAALTEVEKFLCHINNIEFGEIINERK